MIRAKDNPFAVHRRQALGYITQTMSLQAMLDELRRLDHTAAVVGPHGSGKTTLLGHLEKQLRGKGFNTEMLFANCDVKVPWKTIRTCFESMPPGSVLFFDGAGHLNRLRFMRLRRLARKQQIGLVITSHREGLLPTLIRCEPTLELFTEIIDRLLSDQNRIERDRLAALFESHRHNIRECLWELYDEYAAMEYAAVRRPTGDGRSNRPVGVTHTACRPRHDRRRVPPAGQNPCPL
jgi:hypothetical protein